MAIPSPLLDRFGDTRRTVLTAVYTHAMRMLDGSPRFQYFTLHGELHHESLFRNLLILLDGGIEMTEEDLFLLCVAICVHDLGMVLPMKDYDFLKVAEGRPGILDPARFEDFVRDVHHEMIGQYVQNEFSFLTDLGLSFGELATITEIARAHRKVKLSDQRDIVRRLGALMRLIDELDIGPQRAPVPNFLQRIGEMDDVSIWHWYKHIIGEAWTVRNNVEYSVSNGKKEIVFTAVVHPQTTKSAAYWLTQVTRPIRKALDDEQCHKILFEEYGVKISLRKNLSASTSLPLGGQWAELEEKALGHGRPTILVMDDEVKRIDDLFLPLMEKYHVLCVPRVKSGLDQMSAREVNLVIVDMQMPADGIWSETETDDFRFTGIKVAELLRENHPKTKIIALTGIQWALPETAAILFDSILRKPIDPLDLLEEADSCLNPA